jgi:hypothetical protein
MSNLPPPNRPRPKAWLYFIAGLAGSAMLVTVPLFMQASAGALHADGMDDVLLSLPLVSSVHARTGWSFTAQLWWGFSILVCGYAALVATCEWIIRRWLDRDDEAWTCILWALGSWRGWLPWFAALAAAGGLAASAVWLLPESWGPVLMVLMVLPVAAVVLALPFTTWNLDNLRAPRPPRTWRARWPGATPVLAVIALQVAGLAYEGIAQEMSGPGRSVVALEFFFDLVLWIPLLILETVVLLAWLDRARFSDRDALLRTAMQRRILAPVMAFDLRMALLSGMLTLPILPISMLLIFVVPQLQETYGSPSAFGPGWYAWLVAARWVAKWWWTAVIVLFVPLGWYLLVAKARLLVQVDAIGRQDAEAMAGSRATPPSHPDSAPASTTPPTA